MAKEARLTATTAAQVASRHSRMADDYARESHRYSAELSNAYSAASEAHREIATLMAALSRHLISQRPAAEHESFFAKWEQVIKAIEL